MGRVNWGGNVSIFKIWCYIYFANSSCPPNARMHTRTHTHAHTSRLAHDLLLHHQMHLSTTTKNNMRSYLWRLNKTKEVTTKGYATRSRSKCTELLTDKKNWLFKSILFTTNHFVKEKEKLKLQFANENISYTTFILKIRQYLQCFVILLQNMVFE